MIALGENEKFEAIKDFCNVLSNIFLDIESFKFSDKILKDSV